MNQIEISWVSLWRVLLIVIFAVALYFLKDVLLILFLALVISSALDSPISFLEQKRIPRILGTLLVFISVLSVLALILYTIVPLAVLESKNIFGVLNKLEVPDLGPFGSSQFIENWTSGMEKFAETMLSGGASFIGVISSIFGGIAFVIAAFVLSFYLALHKDGVENFLKAILPIKSEDYAVNVYLRSRQKLGLWLKGQLILSAIVGVVVFLGLLILGVKYSLILGILAAILEMVPFVGPVFTGIIAFLLAVSESWTLGISVIIFFFIVQQMENHLLIPAVMRKTVGIHPVVAVISMLAGAQLAGFVGIILAVPTAVVIQEVIESRAARKNQVGRFNFE